jgi:hypothetical protein
MWIFNTSNRAHAVTTPRSDIGTFQAAVILSEVEGSAIAFSLYQFEIGNHNREPLCVRA